MRCWKDTLRDVLPPCCFPWQSRHQELNKDRFCHKQSLRSRSTSFLGPAKVGTPSAQSLTQQGKQTSMQRRDYRTHTFDRKANILLSASLICTMEKLLYYCNFLSSHLSRPGRQNTKRCNGTTDATVRTAHQAPTHRLLPLRRSQRRVSCQTSLTTTMTTFPCSTNSGMLDGGGDWLWCSPSTARHAWATVVESRLFNAPGEAFPVTNPVEGVPCTCVML